MEITQTQETSLKLAEEERDSLKLAIKVVVQEKKMNLQVGIFK